MNDSAIKLFDPRVGQGFTITAGDKTFSSLTHDLYVIDDVGELDWLKEASLLHEVITKTSKLGFFTVAPWFPGARGLRARIQEKFHPVSEFEGSLCGYFDVESDSIRVLFDIRQAFGGFNSGEWGFGGCSESFERPRRISFAKAESWGFFHILSQATKIGCFLYLGEMHHATFMTKIFDGFDSQLNSGLFQAIPAGARTPKA